MDPRTRRNYVPYYVTDMVRKKEIYDDVGDSASKAETVVVYDFNKHFTKLPDITSQTADSIRGDLREKTSFDFGNLIRIL